jgi:bisphosphoglycerate-dependent phosphoglycerate mutase
MRNEGNTTVTLHNNSMDTVVDVLREISDSDSVDLDIDAGRARMIANTIEAQR